MYYWYIHKPSLLKNFFLYRWQTIIDIVVGCDFSVPLFCVGRLLTVICVFFLRFRAISNWPYGCCASKKIKNRRIFLFFCHKLSSRRRVLPEKLTVPQLVKKFPSFYRTRRFIAAFSKPRQLSLSLARSIQPKPPQPASSRSILILSGNLCLGRASFHQVSPPRPCLHLSRLPYVPHYFNYN